jgi:hypothetical protein
MAIEKKNHKSTFPGSVKKKKEKKTGKILVSIVNLLVVFTT